MMKKADFPNTGSLLYMISDYMRGLPRFSSAAFFLPMP